MENITGYIKGVLFFNEQNNYYVIRLQLDQKKNESIVVVGYFELPKKDELYRFFGEYKDHPKYGRQFFVDHYEKLLPSGQDAIVRFLSSSLFPKIGIKTAEKVYELLGDDALTIVKEDITAIYPLHLKPDQYDVIQKGLAKSSRLDEAMKLFVGHGMSVRVLMKLDAVYKEDMTKIILNNPYQMIRDIDGIHFRYADKIALSLGILETDTRRVRAAIIYSSNQSCFKTQSTYTSEEELLHESRKIIPNLEEDAFHHALQDLTDIQDLILEEDRIYPKDLYEAEEGIANYLRPYLKRKIDHINPNEIDHGLTMVEREFAIEYSTEQKEAISASLQQGMSIITGGPGTGKTTVVKALMKVHQMLHPNGIITLCAPTGRAAKRMSDVTGMAATTIHRLLGWNMESNVFTHDENDPLEGDLLIIDEFSMVDMLLFYHLLKGTHSYKQIILIGDDQQLPPVSSGDTLHELLALDFIPRSILLYIHRQKETSGIIPLAYDLRNGVLHEENLKKEDVAFVPCSKYEVKDLVVYFAQKALDKGYTSQDIQVLAPKYDGIAGITALNEVLRELFNPKSLSKIEYQIGRTIFREGDKVLQLKNQPDDDVYNGDIGVLEEIILKDEDENQDTHFLVNFDGNIVSYSSDNFIHITHAYCISVHKAQGSEYPLVFLPLVSDYYMMLRRKLVYTAITRTKQSLLILGEKKALERAIATNDQDVAKSTLQKRIKASLHIL